MKRVKINEGGVYFAEPKAHLDFIGSGSKLLDLALGGGWAEGRVANVIGDKAVGKTLLAIEACANFAHKYDKAPILYRECEAAFDPEYAEALGMPLDRVDFGQPLETVEDFYDDIQQAIDKAKHPTLYILDSLDALSDRAEMGRSLDEGTYGASKAKQLSQVFRRIAGPMAEAKVTLLIVSQIRDNIGAMFGRKFTRSGGKALNFYASQVLILSNLGQLIKKVSGIDKSIGLNVRAKVDKNKVGLPFRQAEFQIIFGYGVDDMQACLDWLSTTGSLDEVDLTKEDVKHSQATRSKYVKSLDKMTSVEYNKEVKRIHDVIERKWWELEKKVLPQRRKYV